MDDSVHFILMNHKSQSHTNYPYVLFEQILRYGVVQMTDVFELNGLYYHLHLQA